MPAVPSRSSCNTLTDAPPVLASLVSFHSAFGVSQVESPCQLRPSSPPESSGSSVAAAAAADLAYSPQAEEKATAPQKHLRAKEEGSPDKPKDTTSDAPGPEDKAVRDEEIDHVKGVAPDGGSAAVMRGLAPEEALLPALAEEKCAVGGRDSWEPREDSSADDLAVVAVQRDVGGDEGAHGGDEERSIAAPSSFRIDLGLEDGWLRNLEAKMGAIKAQVCCFA